MPKRSPPTSGGRHDRFSTLARSATAGLAAMSRIVAWRSRVVAVGAESGDSAAGNDGIRRSRHVLWRRYPERSSMTCSGTSPRSSTSAPTRSWKPCAPTLDILCSFDGSASDPRPGRASRACTHAPIGYDPPRRADADGDDDDVDGRGGDGRGGDGRGGAAAAREKAPFVPPPRIRRYRSVAAGVATSTGARQLSLVQRPSSDTISRRRYLASGSGRSWNRTALLVVPFPPSMWYGVRVLTAAQRPRPFQPPSGSSIRPSSHLV
jgi:hypothetical protein